MRITLDLKKSIETGWVVNGRPDFHSLFEKYLALVFMLSFVLVFSGIPIWIWIMEALGRRKEGSHVFALIMFFLGLPLLYSTLFSNRFIRLRGGADIEKNRQFMLVILKKEYPKNNFFSDGEFFSSYYRPTGFFKRYKSTNRILVLFDHYDVLINISVFNSRGMQSPFHTFFHHITIWRVGRKLKNMYLK